MTEAPDTLIGIEDTDRKAPRSRVPDGSAARRLVSRVIRDDETRNNQRALVQGMVAGNPPYSAAARKSQGRGWEANINWLGGQALMDSSGVPYYAIFTGTEHYAECKTAYRQDDDEATKWNGSINSRFDCFLKRWRLFDREVKQASYWMRMHGIGCVIWPKVGDFRCRSIRTGNVLVPKGSPSCLDKRTPYVVVRDTFTAVELWEFIKGAPNYDGYTAAGWHVPTIRNALQHSAKGLSAKSGWDSTSWERTQQEFKNNDLGTSAECPDISVAHVFVQEFSGKISHFIVTENELEKVGHPTESDKKDTGFLFRALSRYDAYNQVIVPFFIDSGDGTWHSVRGIADKAFRHLEAENRLKCRMLDGAFIRMSVILKSASKEAKKKMLLTPIGATTVLDPGTDVQQLQLGHDIEAGILVDRVLQNHMANNLGVYNQRSMTREDGRGEKATAAEVNQAVLKESSLSQAQISEFYFPLDQVVEEAFRRAVRSQDPEAKRFREECEKDGVPEQALKEMEYVRFNRTAGYGSPQMRLLQHQQMMGIAGRLPEQGLQNLTDDFIGSTAGADKINRYNPKTHVPTADDTLATMENMLIRQGIEPVHYSEENHVTHLDIHTKDAEQMLAPVQEAVEAGGGDPAMLEEAYRYVELMAAHCQGHLAKLQADPARKPLAAMFEDKLDFIVSFSGQLRQAIIRAQKEAELAAQEAEQASVLGVMDEAELQSMQADSARRDEKLAQDEKRKWTKLLGDEKRKNLTASAAVLRQREQAKQQPQKKAA